MNDTFEPHKEEEYIVVKIKKREATLVQKLRKYPFGKFIIHKANNILTRIEINESQIIDAETEIDL